MIRRNSILAAAALSAALGFSAFTYAIDKTQNTNPPAQAMDNEKKMDIVDTAQGPGMPYTTLVAAIKKADLVKTLKGPGPFTVFAPTDDAFKKLPEGTLQDLLKPENKEKLVKILTFHVVPGKHPASHVATMADAKTVEGDSIMFKNVDGKWMVGNDKAWATIIKTDVQASNGIIHWIDTVLMP
jgi:uncharacterized surface protein with fasciclin (FAS1) repeats